MAMKSKASSSPGTPSWYATPAGRRQTQREFESAIKDGTLVRSSGSTIRRSDPKILNELLAKAKANATKPISIRLPVADLDHAQRIAAREGIGYQTVLKRAIRAGLKKVS